MTIGSNKIPIHSIVITNEMLSTNTIYVDQNVKNFFEDTWFEYLIDPEDFGLQTITADFALQSMCEYKLLYVTTEDRPWFAMKFDIQHDHSDNLCLHFTDLSSLAKEGAVMYFKKVYELYYRDINGEVISDCQHWNPNDPRVEPSLLVCVTGVNVDKELKESSGPDACDEGGGRSVDTEEDTRVDIEFWPFNPITNKLISFDMARQIGKKLGVENRKTLGIDQDPFNCTFIGQTVGGLTDKLIRKNLTPLPISYTTNTHQHNNLERIT